MRAASTALLVLLLPALPAVAQEDEQAAPLHPSPGALKGPASAVPS